MAITSKNKSLAVVLNIIWAVRGKATKIWSKIRVPHVSYIQHAAAMNMVFSIWAILRKIKWMSKN